MDADIKERLDKIDQKLDKVYDLQISTAQQETRIVMLENSIKDIKDNKKAWLSPAISAAVSALVSWIISGGLK